MNIRNVETGEWGLRPDDVKSYFEQQEILVIWGEPFEPREPFEYYGESEQPKYDLATHKVVQVAPVENEGEIVQVWKVLPLDTSELLQAEADRALEQKAASDAARVVVTKRQALLALYDLKGVKDIDIDEQIETIEDESQRYRARVDWQGAVSIESDSPTVLMLASALGLSNQELVDLFEYARAL